MQTTLQGWSLLWSGGSSASVITESMLNASQQGWRRMSKQFRTCRHAWGILKPTHLTSPYLLWGHYSLAWLPHQSYCMTLRLQFQICQAQVETFLHELLFTKIKPLTATIHRNKRRKFASEKICAPSGVNMQVAHMERLGPAALVDLAEGSGMIQLDLALERRVTEECLSLFNVDGSMHKTVKSKLLELFSLEPVPEVPQNHVSLVDMGLIWRLATPTPEDWDARKRDGSDYCWTDYLHKICTIIFPKPEYRFPGPAEFSELIAENTSWSSAGWHHILWGRSVNQPMSSNIQRQK